MLAPRHLVEHERAADRFGRRVALLLAELFPVDVGLHRIDLLIDQPPDELLDPPIDLAIEQRRRHVEGDARGELLQQFAAHLALRLVRRLVLEVLAAPASRSASSDAKSPDVLRELVVQLRHDALADRLDRRRRS